MSTHIPTDPTAREHARLDAEAQQGRNEQRDANVSRFGYAHEQQADYEAACRQFGLIPGQTKGKIAVRIVGCATPLPVRGVFHDDAGILTIGVDLPAGFGRTQDDVQAPYQADAAAKAAKIPEDEPHTIIGCGDTARHLRT